MIWLSTLEVPTVASFVSKQSHPDGRILPDSTWEDPSDNFRPVPQYLGGGFNVLGLLSLGLGGDKVLGDAKRLCFVLPDHEREGTPFLLTVWRMSLNIHEVRYTRSNRRHLYKQPRVNGVMRHLESIWHKVLGQQLGQQSLTFMGPKRVSGNRYRVWWLMTGETTYKTPHREWY